MTSETEPTENTTEDKSEKKTLYVKFETKEEHEKRIQEELDKIDDGETVPVVSVRSFTNFENFVTTFSMKKMELLQTISAHNPESIRETARFVERDVSYVHRNLILLNDLGIIEFEKNGRSKKPVVVYDEIQANIPIPLPEVKRARRHIKSYPLHQRIKWAITGHPENVYV